MLHALLNVLTVTDEKLERGKAEKGVGNRLLCSETQCYYMVPCRVTLSGWPG